MTTNTPGEAARLVEQYAQQHQGEYALDKLAYTRFLCLCELADILAEEFDADEVTVRAEPSTQSGILEVETGDLVFEHGRTHVFFQLAQNADMIQFSKSKNGCLLTRLGIEGLWVRQ